MWPMVTAIVMYEKKFHFLETFKYQLYYKIYKSIGKR